MQIKLNFCSNTSFVRPIGQHVGQQWNIFEEGTTLGTVEEENVNALGETETVYNCLGLAENEIFA